MFLHFHNALLVEASISSDILIELLVLSCLIAVEVLEVLNLTSHVGVGGSVGVETRVVVGLHALLLVEEHVVLVLEVEDLIVKRIVVTITLAELESLGLELADEVVLLVVF